MFKLDFHKFFDYKGELYVGNDYVRQEPLIILEFYMG